MPAEDSPAMLVARYLRTNNYKETLDAFLNETGLPLDTGSNPSDTALTIEQILQEKKAFDLSTAFEKVNAGDEEHAWSLPAPSIPTTIDTLPAASNVLHVAVENIPASDSEAADGCQKLIIATGADRTVNLVQPTPPYALQSNKFSTSDSPVLFCAMLSQRYCITSSMSGRVSLHDLATGTVLDTRRDHLKYVVKAACTINETGTWVATAAWDARVLIYHLGPSNSPAATHPTKLGTPVAEIKLPSNPEAIIFIAHPETSTPVLVLTRRDSTSLYYYAIPDIDQPTNEHGCATLELLGRQNLAPHSIAWVAFTPSALAISPKDPSLLAVATSAVPHMKLILVRLLLPPPPPPPLQLHNTDTNTNTNTNTGIGTQSNGADPPLTQVSQARADLARQDREAAAILIHCTTLAPQTPYSTPALAWRPDASGVFVNGDDGVVRGVETSTGKVVATLRNGHEAGSKIRCLWAGWADKAMRDEVVVTGGFDRRLVVWRAERSP